MEEENIVYNSDPMDNQQFRKATVIIIIPIIKKKTKIQNALTSQSEIEDNYYKLKLQINYKETLQFVKDYLQYTKFITNIQGTGGFMKHTLSQKIGDLLKTKQGEYLLLEYNHHKKQTTGTALSNIASDCCQVM